jgi:hypothetical protein
MEQDEEERGEKLETPLYEEDIIEGFSFCSFHTYSGLEVPSLASYTIRLAITLFSLYV